MPTDQDREAAFSQLLLECFRINRRLVTAVAELARGTDVTGAQWGVLGAFAATDTPRTVSQAARSLGLARQGVQRVADVLAEKGLIEYLPNPRHRRAKLARVTERGRHLLDQLQQRQVRWARDVSGDLDVGRAEAATALVRSLRSRLVESVEASPGRPSPVKLAQTSRPAATAGSPPESGKAMSPGLNRGSKYAASG
ncbi:MAG: MarR family winged helix-turn-helix transcriptional regulator [Gammaproteobacteria bacterium]